MNSRITIDVNDQNQPIIKVDYKPSEDVRDKLVKKFLEGFGYNSVWSRFSRPFTGEGISVIEILPIGNDGLVEEAKTMKAWADHVFGEGE